MSEQTVTLELPETVWQWAKRTAAVTQRSVEKVLVDTISTTLPPPLEDVPVDFQEELMALETLSDADLWAVTRRRMSSQHIRQYDRLLEKNRQGTLTEKEQHALEQLRRDADRIMLMRARAFVLLQWRGYRLPTVAEMEKQM